MDSELLKQLSIPLFTGAIGYVINWTGVCWQGIVPNRAAKMGSIAVDKGIAKLRTASDFYHSSSPTRSLSSARRRAPRPRRCGR